MNQSTVLKQTNVPKKVKITTEITDQSDQSHLNDSEAKIDDKSDLINENYANTDKTVSLVYYQYRQITRPAKNLRKPIKT